jgi:hypothetical protein
MRECYTTQLSNVHIIDSEVVTKAVHVDGVESSTIETAQMPADAKHRKGGVTQTHMGRVGPAGFAVAGIMNFVFRNWSFKRRETATLRPPKNGWTFWRR